MENKTRRPANRRGRGPARNSGKGKNFRTTTIDPANLIKEATIQEKEQYVSERTFLDMPIARVLKDTIEKKGYLRPTQIQDESLESLLEGNDLLGLAETGSGKTMAFLLPIIQQIIENRQNPYALIVLPTRELAVQVEQEFRSITKDMKIYSACFIGGTNLNRDISKCRRPSHIVIATPGRLVDLVKRKSINLADFNTLVLDEFDRMLDMGFVNDVKKIISGMKNRKQTMLFSATIAPKQQEIINEILYNPTLVKITSGKQSAESVHQDVVKSESGKTKLDQLLEMLNSEAFKKVIIFDETKHQVKRLTESLNKNGIAAREMHGNKSQNDRQRSLNSFKEGNIQVLVATDVAARGIDVDDVTHVINYRIPLTMDSYIHRIGRTGRAGKVGHALTFVD